MIHLFDPPRFLTFALTIFFLLVALPSAAAQSIADVQVTVTPPSNAVFGGESFNYTAIVRNAGSAKAIDVILLNDPIGIIDVKAASPSMGSCEMPTPGHRRTVRCMLGDIDPGGQVSVVFDATSIPFDDPTKTPTFTPEEAESRKRAAASMLAAAQHISNAGRQLPAIEDRRTTIAYVSAAGETADSIRENNDASVEIELRPSPNGAPLVRILSPKDQEKLSRPAKRRTDFTVKIQAFDPDGTVTKVVVKEDKYQAKPVPENGVYVFYYLGKKYTAQQLDDLWKSNPPPERLAKRTGKDTFEYTITDPIYGPNRLYVEAFDDGGRSGMDHSIFFVKGDATIEIVSPTQNQIVEPGSTIMVETVAKLNEGQVKEVRLIGLGDAFSSNIQTPPLQLVSKVGNTYRHRYVWKDVPAASSYLNMTAVLVEDSGAVTESTGIGILARKRTPISIKSIKNGDRLSSKQPIQIEIDIQDRAAADQYRIYIDGKNVATIYGGYIWHNPPVGTHVIEVVALFNDVEISRSEPVTIHVQ